MGARRGAIRDLLGLPNYTSAVKPLSAQAVAALQKVENNLPVIDSVEMTDLSYVAQTLVKEIETLFNGLEREWNRNTNRYDGERNGWYLKSNDICSR